MRMLIVALISLLPGFVALSQESKPVDPNQGIDDPPSQLGNPINLRSLKELPPLERPPKITLQRALKIAEKFIKEEEIDIASCYLFQIKWGLAAADSDTADPRWHFLWVRLRGNGTPKKNVRVAVSMDGKAQLLDSP